MYHLFFTKMDKNKKYIDAGAYYFWFTEDNNTKNYQDTIIDVHKYHKSLDIPTRWILLDSWRYYHDYPHDGKFDTRTVNFSTNTSIFPDGINYIYQQTGWKFQMQNDEWSSRNDYIDMFEWSINEDAGDALPMEQEFWDYLFKVNTELSEGLIVYEQDHIWQTQVLMDILVNNTYFGNEWLSQIGKAAEKYDINVQLCMNYPRHLLSSVESITMTQARASGDYKPGIDQWMIGISGLFLSSIGLAPSKDNYWTMPTIQPGPYGNQYTNEPYNRLQSVSLSLSNGPIAFSDQIGYSDKQLIMKCCMEKSGLLLRPDTSATMLDLVLFNRAINNKYIGEIWSTYSQIGQTWRYLYLFAANLSDSLTIYPKDFNYHYENYELNTTFIAYEANVTDKYYKVNNVNGLVLSSCYKYDFQLYTFIPLIISQCDDCWYLQGEINKWISVSSNRFKTITMDSYTKETQVEIVGDVNETVMIAFVKPSTLKQLVVKCIFSESQQILINMPEAICVIN